MDKRCGEMIDRMNFQLQMTQMKPILLLCPKAVCLDMSPQMIPLILSIATQVIFGYQWTSIIVSTFDERKAVCSGKTLDVDDDNPTPFVRSGGE